MDLKLKLIWIKSIILMSILKSWMFFPPNKKKITIIIIIK